MRHKIIRLFTIVAVLMPTVLSACASSNTAPPLEDHNQLQTAVNPVRQLIPQYGPNGKFLAPIEPPANDSIPISTREELEDIRYNPGAMYCLTADIDLSGAEWVPIDGFYGMFDGQGHVIHSLTITGEGYEYNGLFGKITTSGVSIKNIGMEDTNINVTRGNRYGYAAGVSGGGTVSNCYNTGAVSISSAYDADNFNASINTAIAGGIVVSEANNPCEVEFCYNTGPVFASGTSGGVIASGSAGNCFNTGDISAQVAGGIAGSNAGDKINSCYNLGAVTASVASGGIIGTDNGGFIGTISNCFNNGTVTADAAFIRSKFERSSSAGGICGIGGENIQNSCNTGTVSASNDKYDAHAGGICGIGGGKISSCYNNGAVSAASGDYHAHAGGICGDHGEIYNCYNTGMVSAVFEGAESSAYAGGIIGDSGWSKSVSNSYNIGEIYALSSCNYIGGLCGEGDATNSYSLNNYGSQLGTQLTEEQMKNPASYAEWDLNNIWDISPPINNGYPYLRAVPPAN